MARARSLIRATLVVLAAAVTVAALALSAGDVQTWLVRQVLAARPDWHASVDAVRIGWGRVEVENLAWRKGPLAVKLPMAQADLAVWPLLAGGRWKLGNVRIPAAELMVLDPVGPLLPTISDGLEEIAHGFGTWEFPMALEIERLDLAGAVRAPGWPAATQLRVRGGGLGIGREARLEVECQAETGNAEVARVGAAGTLLIRMRSARRPDHVGFDGEVRAEGSRWPAPVRVSLALSATDHGTYQDYHITGWTDERPLVAWGARMTDAVAGTPAQMTGTWMLDLQPGDLTPLLPGSPLAGVTLRSEGRFQAAEPFAGFVFEGTGRMAGDEPRFLVPWWPARRGAALEGGFRLRQAGPTSRLESLQATLTSGAARITMQAQRAFDLHWQGGVFELVAPAEHLATVEVARWPWELLPPSLRPAAKITGGGLSGRMAVWPHDGGWSLRSEGEVTTEPMDIAVGPRVWCTGARARADATLDWLAAGWQLEVRQLTIEDGGGDFLRGGFKCGQLVGPGEPLKLAGKVTVDLGRMGHFPLWPEVEWHKGELVAEVAASLGAVRGWRGEVQVRGGSLRSTGSDLVVPALKADVRLEVDAADRVAFDLPFIIGDNEAGRDLRLAGTFKSDPLADKWELSASAQRLRGEDLTVLAALSGKREGWGERLLAGEGRLGFRVGRLEWTDGRELRGMEGTLRVQHSRGDLQAKAAWSMGGDVSLQADLSRDASAAGGARVKGEIASAQVGASELWRLVGPVQTTPLEGPCDATLRFAGPLASPLSDTLDLSVVSRGGIFHGLPVSFVRVAESTNRLTTWLASAGLAFNTLTGRSTEDEIAGRSQAVGELVRSLNPLTFDQFTLRAARGSAGAWRMRELALITPELRLLGEGTVAGTGGDAAPLTLDLRLLARGRPAELLQYLGVLDGARDTLGYAGCALPVHLTGTLGRREALELNQRLAALSVEKPGMVDKALEFLGRWRNLGTDGATKP